MSFTERLDLSFSTHFSSGLLLTAFPPVIAAVLLLGFFLTDIFCVITGWQTLLSSVLLSLQRGAK